MPGVLLEPVNMVFSSLFLPDAATMTGVSHKQCLFTRGVPGSYQRSIHADRIDLAPATGNA